MILSWFDSADFAMNAMQVGKVLAYPTEGVYGIGGDATREAVAERVLQLKQGRPMSKGLILVVSDWSQCLHWCDGLNDDACERMSLLGSERATTFIIPANKKAPVWVRHESGTLAIRLSHHPIVRSLCEHVSHPLISTSANLPGESPARSAQEAQDIFPDIDVIDGELGDDVRPSRIIDWSSGQIVRE